MMQSDHELDTSLMRMDCSGEVAESVAHALECENRALLPYMPYILQDFWEIGTSGEMIARIVRDCVPRGGSGLRVLDLGCGKGAASIKLAAELGCVCLGIDAVDPFIREARRKAAERGVEEICRFECADARVRVKSLDTFDVILLGSIGPVFGSCYDTLALLQQNLDPDGIIILDDGYLPDDDRQEDSLIPRKSELFAQMEQAGMSMVREYISPSGSKRQEYELEFGRLQRRCQELALRLPDLKPALRAYLAGQEREYRALDDRIICSAMVLRRTK